MRFCMSLALLLSVLGAPLAGAETPKVYFSLHELGHGVWAAIEMPGSHGGGNAGFVVGDDGVLVVDTFQPPEASAALLAAIRRVTDKPIRYLVDTHYHMDHIAGNGLFANSGAVVLAQRNVRAWARRENHRILLPPVEPEELKAIGEVALPSLVYKDGVEIYLGEKKITARVMPGHTGSDTVVVVPDAKVVFTGDLYWDHALPNLVDANTRELIATLETLVHDYPDFAFVPGHGKFVTGAELDHWGMAHAGDLMAFRDYLAELRKDVARALAAGKSGPALEEEVRPRLNQRFGDWFAFDFFVPKNIQQTEQELTGTKQTPQPAP